MCRKNKNEKDYSDYTSEEFRLGLDIGSATEKLVLIYSGGNVNYSDYRRNKADVMKTLLAILNRLEQSEGSVTISPVFTGSAGIGLTERSGVPFVQEVVAASMAVMSLHPQCRMFIDIGGEESKMFFSTMLAVRISV